MGNIPYSRAVGCLMYAMVFTRLNISYAVSIESIYMANPASNIGGLHYGFLDTANHRLLYGYTTDEERKVIGYEDFDYAGDLNKMRSLTGYLFLLNNCTINWKATLQNVVALSTTKAEYATATEAIKEAIWLKGIVTELGHEQKQLTIFSDNQSAISLSKNQVHHEKAKHIDIKTHFIKLEVTKGVVKLKRVHTDDNVADMPTKPVPRAKFEHCLNLAKIYKI